MNPWFRGSTNYARIWVIYGYFESSGPYLGHFLGGQNIDLVILGLYWQRWPGLLNSCVSVCVPGSVCLSVTTFNAVLTDVQT